MEPCIPVDDSSPNALVSIALAPVLAHTAAAPRVPYKCKVKASKLLLPPGYQVGITIVINTLPFVVVVRPQREALAIPDGTFEGTLPQGAVLRAILECQPDNKPLFSREAIVDYGSTLVQTLHNPHTQAVILRYKIIATNKPIPSGIYTGYEFEVQVVQA